MHAESWDREPMMIIWWCQCCLRIARELTVHPWNTIENRILRCYTMQKTLNNVAPNGNDGGAWRGLIGLGLLFSRIFWSFIGMRWDYPRSSHLYDRLKPAPLSLRSPWDSNPWTDLDPYVRWCLVLTVARKFAMCILVVCWGSLALRSNCGLQGLFFRKGHSFLSNKI